jgi:peptidoglycan/xylan/chitin deacetylase (PgdA/CDA1 family)
MSKTALLAKSLQATGLGAAARAIGCWSGLLVLNYHRIGDGAGSEFDRGLWSASAEAFDQQVRFLKKNADVITPREFADVLGRKKGRYITITFDDGYRDNYEIAFSVLRSHGVSAAFFVTTGFIDTGRLAWWDEIAWIVRTSGHATLRAPGPKASELGNDAASREGTIGAVLKAYKTLPADSTESYLDELAEAAGTGRFPRAEVAEVWMTWDMIREMRDSGMVIGGHTVTHPILARLSDARQREEIAGCAQRLREELGTTMDYFSYPVGHPDCFNAATRDCLRAAGVRYAFSYYGGLNRFDEFDDYDVRRVAIEAYIGREWFQSIVTLPTVFARRRA